MTRDENQNVEYKESWHDKYLEWICGYANAKGGTLYIGIEDGTKKPVGVKNANKLMEDIPNSIRNTMGIVADVAMLKKQGKDVIRIKVAASTFPVSYQGRFHYRTGSVKMLLTGPALTQFLMERSGQQWDCVPCFGGYRAADFTFIALKSLYEKANGTKMTTEDLLSFGLATETGVMTNTGALLADESPIRHSRVFCTRWNGLDMTAGVMDAADDQEYSGGLLQLLKYAEDFVRLHSRRAWHKRPTDRVNFREYPERSIQEMLINGFVHRDYLETGSEVHVDIFDDRIEITSPGGMPGDRKVQEYTNIRRIPSRRRNVTLPNLLYGFTDVQLVAAVDDSSYGVPKNGAKASSTRHDTPPVAPPVTPPVAPPVDEKQKRLIQVLKDTELGTSELLKALRIRDRNYLREGYIRPTLRAGLIEQTRPEVKHSRFQKYRLTDKGRAFIVV